MNPRDIPAFPVPANELCRSDSHHGMTLRDYFAAKAMQGFCANPESAASAGKLAAAAYRVADAMLNERGI